MKLPQFRVLLVEGTTMPEERVVTILHGDQLRAELEAPKHKLFDMAATPMHYTTLWVWAALVRTGHTKDDFRTFKPNLLALEAVEDDDNDSEAGPTRTGAATA